MKKKIVVWIRQKGIFALLSFMIPAGIMALVYYQMGSFPAEGYNSILASDAYGQYSMFFGGFNNMIRNGNSILYNWNASLGLNNIAFMSYYLNSIFTPLALFFENIHIDYFFFYLTLLKFGSLGLTFWIYASNTFRLKSWMHTILAISYALMGFSVAYAEVTVWFDGLIFLPLIILGINRLMDLRKPMLLFISYFIVFIMNFYIAFMVGVFSFLYFWARFMTKPKTYGKKSIILYLATSFTAGGASMAIIIPTILDIVSNGESLSEINRFFTRTANPLAIIIKNMIGVYDSTKWDTLPFIYSGTLAMLFCIFFFVTKKIPLRNKIAYGSVLGFIFISFYLEVLDLLWHGMHSPNMLLFRYSFTFSFMVITLAGYALEKYSREDFSKLMNIIFIVFGLFVAVKIYTNYNDEDYPNFYTKSLIFSIVILACLLGLLWLHHKKKIVKALPLITVCVMSLDLWLNANSLIQGVYFEWGYPSFSAVTSNYDDITELVTSTKEDNPDHFYRMENVNTLTRNDSFFYGYSGVAMFSSIRNRHSSQYLNALGFKSTGTNLQVSYRNNTILMDSLLGVKYNLTDQPDLLKFGYKKVKKSGNYSLYENEYVLPMGILTDNGIYQDGAVPNQTALINYLAGLPQTDPFFVAEKTEVIKSKNIKFDETEYGDVDVVRYSSKDVEKPLEISYKVEVPANQQAYLSIFPTGDAKGNPTFDLEVNDCTISFQPSMDGQYVSLGYYEEATTLEVKIKMTFYELERDDKVAEIFLVKPSAVMLDTDKFASTVKKIQEQGVEISVDGHRATAKLDLDEDRVLLTTIPYDKGWKAYVDGEEVEIPTFKDAFLAIPIEEGEHTLELVYFPYGMKLGLGISGVSVVLFGGMLLMLKRKKKEDPQNTSNDSGESGPYPKGDAEPEKLAAEEAGNESESTLDEELKAEKYTEFQKTKEENKPESLVTPFDFSSKSEGDFVVSSKLKIDIEKKDTTLAEDLPELEEKEEHKE